MNHRPPAQQQTQSLIASPDWEYYVPVPTSYSTYEPCNNGLVESQTGGRRASSEEAAALFKSKFNYLPSLDFTPTPSDAEEDIAKIFTNSNQPRRKRKKPSKCILIILTICLLALVGLCGGIIGRLIKCQKEALQRTHFIDPSNGSGNTWQADGSFPNFSASASLPLYDSNDIIHDLLFTEGAIEDEISGELDLPLTLSALPSNGVTSEFIQLYGEDTPIVRLPKTVLPLHYNLRLTFFSALYYVGIVEITFETTQLTKEIVLHSKYHKTDSINLWGSSKGFSNESAPLNESFRIPVLAAKHNLSAEFLTLHLHKYIRPGRLHTLRIEFTSSTCNNPAIHCDYTEPGGRLIFATKLEPLSARALFPCFDEPALKATFNVTVSIEDAFDSGNSEKQFDRHPQSSWRHRNVHDDSAGHNLYAHNTTVLSNEAAYSVEHNSVIASNGQRGTTHRFHRTPRMSTYTFGLVVGEFACDCAVTSAASLPICVYVPLLYANHIPFALAQTVRYFDILQDYFIVPYSLSKLDVVGTTKYPTAAMENWGLIVHNMASLITNPHLPNRATTEHLVKRIIIHELAHQWFGNLVTMEWWDDIWLNEGFAQFYSYHFLEEPDALIVQTAYYTSMIGFFSLQSQTQFQLPLTRNLTTHSELEGLFHGSGYYHLYVKGAAMVRMLVSLMSRELVRRGLVHYFQKFQFQSANNRDLWNSLEAIPGAGPIGEIMNSWVVNPGFPEVHLHRSFKTGLISAKQTIAQQDSHKAFERFEKIHTSNYISKSGSTWTIPLSYISSHTDGNHAGLKNTSQHHLPNDIKTIWFYNQSKEIPDQALAEDDWVLANPNMDYPYLANYDLKNWKLLQRQLVLNHTIFSPETRSQLIFTAAYFLRYSKSDLTIYLKLLRYLSKEEAVLPWVTAIPQLESLFLSFRATPIAPLLSKYFAPTLAQLEYLLANRFASSDSQAEVAARSLLNQRSGKTCRLMCATNQQSCTGWMSERFSAVLLTNLTAIFSDRCGLTNYCHRMRHRLPSEEREALEMILTGDAPISTIDHLWEPIMCIADPDIRTKLANASLHASGLKSIARLIVSPLLLEYDPSQTDIILTAVDQMTPENRKDLFQWVDLWMTVAPRTNSHMGGGINRYRWTVATLADAYRAAKTYPKSWLTHMDDYRREIKQNEMEALHLTTWLSNQLFRRKLKRYGR